MNAKEQKIKEAYESLGFEWIQIKHMVTENGVLILPNPELKYILKGYDNLVADKEKFLAFGSEGLKLQPSILSGIYNNNGWIKVDSEEDLPKENGMYWTIAKYNEICANTWGTFGENKFTFDNGHVTHYQKVIKPKPPIY